VKTYFEREASVESIENLKNIRADREAGFWVIFSIIIATITLCIIGIVIQYSSLGNLSEKKQFQVKYQNDKGEGRSQYIDLLIQTDRLLLNRKKIWAIFFLCFSTPRNFMILFYDTEK